MGGNEANPLEVPSKPTGKAHSVRSIGGKSNATSQRQVERVDPDDVSFRVASVSIRGELYRCVEESVLDEATKTARKQLLDKVLACSMRMVNLHDDIHKLGNEIRDRNAVIADLDSKISWNQSRIDDETLQKHGNTANRDRLVEELAQAEQLGRIKDKQINETDENLKVQNQKNVKLQGIVDTAEKGNLQIRKTLENCREQLTSALD